MLVCGTVGTSWAKDVIFIARDFDGREAVWQSDAVLLEQFRDSEEELTFILDNPTTSEHAFVMPGVKVITREVVLTPEQSADIQVAMPLSYVEPLTVTVKAGERKTMRIHAGELLAAKSAGKSFRYFCPIHKDLHRSGELFVM
jgi:hypothetical protein